MPTFLVLYATPPGAALNTQREAQGAIFDEARWEQWLGDTPATATEAGSALGLPLRLSGQGGPIEGTAAGAARVIGYSVLHAASITTAFEALDEHPHLHIGGIEILPLVNPTPYPH